MYCASINKPRVKWLYRSKGCLNSESFIWNTLLQMKKKNSLQWPCFSLSPPETMQTEMAAENHSSVTEFILAGLTEQPWIHLPLFLLFLVIYVVTVVGDLGMITLIGLSSHLHTPMYYFLSNLSFIDLCQSTVITPRMLGNFGTEKNIISYPECMTQLFFFLLFIIAEGYLLAAMTYEHYVAICSPLLYNTTMSHQACFSLIFECIWWDWYVHSLTQAACLGFISSN